MKRFIGFFAIVILAACSYNKEELPSPEAGESSETPAYTGPTITYTAHVKKYFDNYCTACHAPGATQSFFPLTTFNEVSVYSGNGGKIETRVLVQANMPPTGSATGDLTTLEKDTLQMWIDQGAPQ